MQKARLLQSLFNLCFGDASLGWTQGRLRGSRKRRTENWAPYVMKLVGWEAKKGLGISA
jgi:hypothetical protein